MQAMQYEITLPADYDMGIIHRRIADRGSLLDDFPGLGLKAYLVRERGVDSSPVNQYAPFYLWTDLSGMNRFLWGGAGFSGIVADFGRPPVRTWTGAAFRPGPAFEPARAAGQPPAAASRRIEPLPPGSDPADYAPAAYARLCRRAADERVYAAALAIDPAGWQAMQLTLWLDAAPKTEPDRFRAGHLSAPDIGALRAGAHWRAPGEPVAR